MTPFQILTRLGWERYQIEGLEIRCLKEGKSFALEARAIQRQAMRDGSFPDPLTRFLRVLVQPLRRALIRLGASNKQPA